MDIEPPYELIRDSFERGKVIPFLGWYGPYSAEDLEDPMGPPSGEYRVFRGGSYWFKAHMARAARRFSVIAGGRSKDVGFRVVLPVAPSD